MSFLLPQRSAVAVGPLSPLQALDPVDRPEQAHVLLTTRKSSSAGQLVKPRSSSRLKMSWTLRMTLVIVLMMRKRRTMLSQETMSFKTTVRSGRVGPDTYLYILLGTFLFLKTNKNIADAIGPAPGNRFDLSFRNAMNTLPSNTPLMTSSSIFPRPSQSFFPGFGMKENDSMAFPMHPPGAMHGYFPQNRHHMQASASGFNPLYLQRQETYPFLYGGHSFEASKPPTPAFQTLNGTDFTGMESTSSFQPDQAQQNDFDV